jgi:hypothetical protein
MREKVKKHFEHLKNHKNKFIKIKYIHIIVIFSLSLYATKTAAIVIV